MPSRPLWFRCRACGAEHQALDVDPAAAAARARHVVLFAQRCPVTGELESYEPSSFYFKSE